MAHSAVRVGIRSGSALLLLVFGVLANHHDAAFALDDFAFLANGFYRRPNFHLCFLPLLSSSRAM